MCGLAGFFHRNSQRSSDDLRSICQAMGDCILHRGPDDFGVFVDEPCGVGFAFRRLAIIDTSPLGHQPMPSHSGRFEVMLNGEVYNFARIRQKLEEHGKLPPLRGGSDTEIICAAIEAWGVAKAIQEFIGMFAIVVWDREQKELHIIRDRVGVKPLYLARFGNTFMYASELKSLRAHPEFRAEIDREALALYVRFGYVPSPYSIYKNVTKVQTGSIVTIPLSGEPSVQLYWDANKVVSDGKANRFAGTFDEATEHLENLLRDAIGLRMIADVPLGAFLSGGVDSSAVVALMQAQSSQPVKTFTIGFEDKAYNEAEHAKEIAKLLGTDHTELYVTGEKALTVVPMLPDIYDEPFADSSQIPTYLVSELARKRVTVSLSGDGGDELFGGYNRYSIATKIWGKYEKLPSVGKWAAKTAITKISPKSWDRMAQIAGPLVPKSLRFGNIGDKVARLAEAVDSDSPSLLYTNLVSFYKEPSKIVKGGIEPPTEVTAHSNFASMDEFAEKMMELDLKTYLQEDIMAKVDRASMAVSLEAREPLLDHRVIEFAWTLPTEFRFNPTQTKRLLRSVLYKYVPPELIERPKQGFAVPLADWLRGPLREWAEELLDEARLEREGNFHPEPIREIWHEHLAGKRNWHYYLWVILMFQSWHERWMGSSQDRPNDRPRDRAVAEHL